MVDNRLLEFDVGLLKKYDKSGPRYTSYPTAPQFTDSFTSEQLQNEIQQTNADPTAPPISIYFLWPFC
jgi:oxygen-independent coproporphyrinogen III oxidase